MGATWIVVFLGVTLKQDRSAQGGSDVRSGLRGRCGAALEPARALPS